MKYVSIDIETAGLGDDVTLLEIGAIVEDTTIPYKYKDIPKFEAIIDRNIIVGEPYALRMNARIIDILAEYQDIKDPEAKAKFKRDNNIYSEIEAVEAFHRFIWEKYVDNGEEYKSPFSKSQKGKPSPPVRVACAGKNFGTFDRPRLQKLKGISAALRFDHRILDPAILFVDWAEDAKLPGLDLCKTRAGIKGKVTHKAVEDAWDVIEVLRVKY
jgi:hypothetical protein